MMFTLSSAYCVATAAQIMLRPTASVLRSINLDEIESHGYCFQIDMTWRVLLAGGSVREVPITFVEREAGVSKMSGFIIREALVKVTVWGLQRLVGRRPKRASL